MKIKDVEFESPEDNILFDEVLLESAERGYSQETLRFWESQVTFIVLGRISNLETDVKTEAAQEDRVPILRRCSGGGTVVQGTGCLNYALILSKQRSLELTDVRRSYRFILSYVIEVLKRLQIEASFYPSSDLALTSNQKKISGNAQKRSKKYILHHGTLLYDFDLTKIERYLTFPKDRPAYRQARAHLDFVDNLRVSPKAIKQAFYDVFQPVRKESGLTAEEAQWLEVLRKSGGLCTPFGRSS